ncbi:MAG TPA: glycoside hydrolase family 130 protein [Acidimicrobiales bacterium]
MPDPSRVVTRMFVPGQEGFEQQDSRTAAVVARVMALDEDDVGSSFRDVMARFDRRHRDLRGIFRRHAAGVADRLESDRVLSDQRQLLLGATFTTEYAIEAAALCNPSIVPHPDQNGAASGSLRFVMSVRGVGEGHRSSIGFRTGTVDAEGNATVDPPAPFATAGAIGPVPLEAAVFRSELRRLRNDGENADYVLDALGSTFTFDALEARLAMLHDNLATRRRGERTIALVRAIAERTYGITFEPDTELAERVLLPAMAAERHGMEDARFVRFTDDDGRVSNYATYTAYDGAAISQQMLETADFRSFTSAPIVGAAAANKGLALFPRRIGGRFVALSRADRETNAVAFSDNPRQWPTAETFQVPARPWELLQLGNCGSPIETDEGWLVLTHGVGPVRTYSIGAILLDLDDPTVVLAQLPEPLLTPAGDEQDGYVPNVVYSCGSLVHAGTLVLPYGIGDAAIGIASVALGDVLAALASSPAKVA